MKGSKHNKYCFDIQKVRIKAVQHQNRDLKNNAPSRWPKMYPRISSYTSPYMTVFRPSR